MARFLANPEQKTTPKPKRETPSPKRRTALKQESPKHKENRGLWKLIKQAMVLAQERTNGFTSCMECGLQTRDLDLDHIIPSGNGGAWLPHNAQLLCRGPRTNDCHGRKHGQPEWSRADA